jgi:drug/metabolite transporter (DMT)-like permease
MYLENHDTMKVFILGPVLMVFSSLSYAFMTLFAKLATEHISSSEVTFMRLLMGVLVTLVIACTTNVELITKNTRMLVIRGFFGGLAVLLFFLAIEKGTITNSVVLQNTYPIFAAIIAIYALKEKLNTKLVACLAVTFLGILLLTRPNFGNIRIGDVFALASGLLGAFAITAVRTLRKQDESVWTIFFYFCIFGAIISLFLAVPNWKWPSPNEWLLIAATAILGLSGQVTMTAAYKYCTTTIGGILSMSTGVFSFILGVFFLGENFILIDVLAVFLIITGNVLVVADVGKNKGQDQVAEL